MSELKDFETESVDKSKNEKIIADLHGAVVNFVQTIGQDNKIAQGLLEKLESLQKRLEVLTGSEKMQFLENMRDSFHSTIAKIEQKLQQHERFLQVRNYSLFAAIIFVVICTFALFGYKLYKSLKQKELKKQEKLKSKQNKKGKKSN